MYLLQILHQVQILYPGPVHDLRHTTHFVLKFLVRIQVLQEEEDALALPLLLIEVRVPSERVHIVQPFACPFSALLLPSSCSTPR